MSQPEPVRSHGGKVKSEVLEADKLELWQELNNRAAKQQIGVGDLLFSTREYSQAIDQEKRSLLEMSYVELGPALLWSYLQDWDEVAAFYVNYPMSYKGWKWTDYDWVYINVVGFFAQFEVGEFHSDGDAQWVDAFLLKKLRSGEVRTIGRFEHRGELKEIPVFEWESLLFLGSRTLPSGRMAAIQKTRIKGSDDEENPGHWSQIRFEVSSLLKAFPESEEVATSDWRAQPGESLTSWIMRSAPLEEAQRRVAASGRKHSKAAENECLSEMARECSRTWKADSIGSIRRQYVK